MATHEVTLDLAKPAGHVMPQVTVRVGDVGSQTVKAALTANGAAYTPPSGATARLDVLHADGTWCRVPATLAGSTASAVLTAQALASPGTCRLAHFVVIDGAVVESTGGIELRILPNVDVSAEEAQAYRSQLDDLMASWDSFSASAVAAEAARVAAEKSRASAEEGRQTAEADRVKKANLWAGMETARQAAETKRASAEEARAAAEAARVAAEKSRASAETARGTAEGERASAESKRKAEFADMMAAAQGTKTKVCADGEYDASTRVPALAGAPGIVYLVPSDDPKSGDSYVEWLFIDGSFERIGTSGASLEGIGTDDIDAITGGEGLAGEEVLNKTGLSYFWGRLKSALGFNSLGVLGTAAGGTGNKVGGAARLMRSCSVSLSGSLVSAEAVAFNGTQDVALASTWAAGVVLPYAGADVPAGWLACDGSAVSRTDYAALFAAVGTKFGAGDGSTTFNVPDLRGRFPLGSSDAYAMGATGGEETHKLTGDEMPAHSHAISRLHEHYNAGGAKGVHRTQWTDSNDASAAVMRTDVMGATEPHNNMPPYLAIGYIVSTGK